MSTLKFAETHNLVAFLEKPKESNGFEGIIDLLNASSIKYALTVNPTVYESCIKQFWATAKANTVNGECQIQALVDKKKVIITEKSVRSDLMLEDVEGIECLPNDVIFEQLTLMGYENLTQKLTFYKAYFSSQWKFLIHKILQCLSAKTTTWNEFSNTNASAIICLATNKKFNFSKYIFDNMMNNLEGGVKFLMYPRFVQVFLDKQVEEMSKHKGIYVTPSHIKKISSNGSETIGFNKSKVDCYNCHKRGHFARKCRVPRENKNKELVRRNVTVETTETKSLVAQDGLGYDWSDQTEEGPTNFALMAYTSSGSTSS
ncbi:reverse transcriptase domain-containing protein [Tanacetum coccineum]